MALANYDEPNLYGVKVPIAADIYWRGCFAGTIEGYALTFRYSPEVMDVTLIKEASRDPQTRERIGEDRPGPSLCLEDSYDPDRAFLRRHLMRAAKSNVAQSMIEDAWTEWKAWEHVGRAADAYMDRREGWVQ